MSQEYVRKHASFASAKSTGWLLPYVLIAAALLIALATVFGIKPGDSSAQTQGEVGQGTATPNPCQVPVDISLVFDHSGSMSQTNKLQNAQQAAAGFVNQLAGGDGNLSPHQMALTGFSDGIAVTDVALTNNANTLSAAINGYTAADSPTSAERFSLARFSSSGARTPTSSSCCLMVPPTVLPMWILRGPRTTST